MVGGSILRRHRGAVIGALVAALVAAIAGTASASPRHTSATAPKPATAAQWKALIAKAKQEGSVTIYTVSNPTSYANMAAAFKAKYGINVNVNRNVDNVILAQINAEESTGKAVADIWVATAKPYVSVRSTTAGSPTPSARASSSKQFDRKTLMFGKAWISGEAVLGDGLEHAGRTEGIDQRHPGLHAARRSRASIGVPDPRVSTCFMDWYLWAEGKYGEDIIQKLAAQNPKIYTSTAADDAGGRLGRDHRRPVRSRNRADAQGRRRADRLQGAAGQLERAVLRRDPEAGPAPERRRSCSPTTCSRPKARHRPTTGFGALYPNIPGTFYSKIRDVNLNDFTPAKVAAFNDNWVNLFTK